MNNIKTNITIKFLNKSSITISEIDISNDIGNNLHHFKGEIYTDYGLVIDTSWNKSGYCNFSDDYSFDIKEVTNKVKEYKEFLETNDSSYYECEDCCD